jgi:hypothetical protein
VPAGVANSLCCREKHQSYEVENGNRGSKHQMRQWGVIHPLLAVIRGDRAFVVGQLDGTGSTKVRHAPPRNGAIELSALEEPDAIPVAAVSVNPEPAWNPSSIRGGRTLLKSEIGVALYYSILVAGEHFIRPHARGPGYADR